MKKGVSESLWGGKPLFKMPGEKIFWGEIEIFWFCLGGELTLDDTMASYRYSISVRRNSAEFLKTHQVQHWRWLLGCVLLI